MHCWYFNNFPACSPLPVYHIDYISRLYNLCQIPIHTKPLCTDLPFISCRSDSYGNQSNLSSTEDIIGYSNRCTPYMCAYACVYVHTKHLRSLFSWLTVRILYQLSFSLGLWEGKVVCIRPSLAIGTHRGALAYIRWGIRLECAGGGGGGGGERQNCRHAAIYIHRAVCMCVW